MDEHFYDHHNFHHDDHYDHEGYEPYGHHGSDPVHSHELLHLQTGVPEIGQVIAPALPSEAYYPHFNEEYHGTGIIGIPAQEMLYWHMQQHDSTCAVVSQEYILESFGIHLSEDQLAAEAQAHGWYTPNGGTPLDCMGDLLALHGLPVVSHMGATMNELAERLAHGQKVVVSVDSEDIWFHGTPNDPISAYPGIPGQNPDHAIEVIGINETDLAHPMVIINDPGIPDGQGIMVPMAVFEEAWATSDHQLVATGPGVVSGHGITRGSGVVSKEPVMPNYEQYTMTVGGYYNSDGSYHSESDNTDRDPQTN